LRSKGQLSQLGETNAPIRDFSQQQEEKDGPSLTFFAKWDDESKKDEARID